MTNLVEIDIRANDLTGPGFASALARAEALKKALQEASFTGFDMQRVDSQLSILKSKLQAHGVADLLDINMNQGQIEQQIMLLKRKVSGAKISDVLDVNLDEAQIARQMADLADVSVPLKVTPELAGSVNLGSLGGTVSEKLDIQGLAAAEAGLASVRTQADAMSASLVKAAAQKDAFSKNVTGTLNPALTTAGANVGFLRNHIQLFGGALGALPFLGTVTGLHLILDSVVEVASELVPAAIAFGAFAIAAVPAVKSIYAQEKALYTVSQALNQQMPGLSGNFSKVAAAVQPEVYILFGEALDTMNRNTGTFMTLATGAGHVLDGLGARVEAALGSSGMTGFASKAVDDLQVLGNIIGNVSGIFGNMLKVMPGYAEILFHALQDVTGALEAITGSSVVQGFLSIGLSLHGFIVWGGLAATAAITLGNAVTGLGVRMGLLSAGTTMFDGAAFVAGMTQAAGGAALLGGELVTLGAAEDVAAAGALTLEGVMAAISAVNPVVWIAAAIGGIAGLVMWLGSMKSASQQAFDAFQKQLSDASTFTSAFATITEGVKQTNAALTDTPKYIDVMTHSAHDQYTTVRELNPAWQQLTDNSRQYGAEQSTLTSRMDELNKITGSQANTLNALNQIGVKAGSIANESASAFANQKIQVRALTDATTQLAGFTSGQAAAAQNALTNAFMTGTLPAIQKVTQAEDSLMSVITGSTSAMDTFQIGMDTLQQNLQSVGGKAGAASASLNGMKSSASLLGATLGGTTQADYALNQAFYTQIGNAQKVIDALQQQSTSTRNLKTATATMAGQMITYAGTNTAARSVIVDMINNALGPGTVSLQSLNKWVGHNSTSLQGLNSIIAQSTIQAGTLAGVLQADLNAQFQQALLKSSGASQAIQALTDAITHGGTQTHAYASARAQLITDLEKTGMSAQDATSYVNGLQGKINSLHGKSVAVTANTGSAVANINGVITALHNIPANVASVINTYNITHNTVYNSPMPPPPKKAMGGIVGNVPYAASGGWRNGLTMVGELGPELVSLPVGSRVWPHGIKPPGFAARTTVHSSSGTQPMLDQGGGDGIHITLELGQSFRQAGLTEQQLEDLRYTVRIKGGGDVQRALGVA